MATKFRTLSDETAARVFGPGATISLFPRKPARNEPEPTSRVMSLSYERDAAEQAAFMMEAGTRFVEPQRARYTWRFVAVTTSVGAVIGLSMEAYRLWILSPLLGEENVAPLNILVLQFLPFFGLLGALYWWRERRHAEKKLETLTKRLESRHFVDIDVFRDGLQMSIGSANINVDWLALRHVRKNGARIEFEGESYCLYIPRNAFADDEAFNAAFHRLQTLWRDAKEKQMLRSESADKPLSGRKSFSRD